MPSSAGLIYAQFAAVTNTKSFKVDLVIVTKFVNGNVLMVKRMALFIIPSVDISYCVILKGYLHV